MSGDANPGAVGEQVEGLAEGKASAAPRRRPWWKMVLGGLVALLLVAVAVAVGVGWGWWFLSRSLPPLEGRLEVAGLEEEVTITRDDRGIPRIEASSARDAVFGLGFVHAQDRLFQMDTTRRAAAGELAELFGSDMRAIGFDRSQRIHRARWVAQQALATAAPQERALLEAYAAGVNAGAASLASLPWEYAALGARFAPWKPEDGLVVGLAMAMLLQANELTIELVQHALNLHLPPELTAFLRAPGNAWEAPIDRGRFVEPIPPGPEVLDLRNPPAGWRVEGASESLDDQRAALWRRSAEEVVLGSNNWAVSGTLTDDGRALVANDMHLGLGVPATWYQATAAWPDPSWPEGRVRLCGGTLPGAPGFIVGSNGLVAWGVTHVAGDWFDWIPLTLDPNDSNRYRTPDGWRNFETMVEPLKVNGSDTDDEVRFRVTVWGPVIEADQLRTMLAEGGRGVEKRRRTDKLNVMPLAEPLYALRWVAHQPEAINGGILRLNLAKNVAEALELAPEIGVPHINAVLGDAQGHVAWTILGRIPRRVGFDGSRPEPGWADGSARWEGWTDRSDHPRVVDPPSGRIWTANNRVVSVPSQAALIGMGTYDRGARASIIRDRLDALKPHAFDEAAMLAIQLDDRAMFLARWRDLIVGLIDADPSPDPRFAEVRNLLVNDSDRAAIDSVGFRLLFEYRARVHSAVLDWLLRPCFQADPDFNPSWLLRNEAPIWALIESKPMHLLDRRYETWEAFLRSELIALLDRVTRGGAPFTSWTWGARNQLNATHPFSDQLAAFGLQSWLSLPVIPLPGAPSDMPRIQGVSEGASQRMAVRPGREESAYFQLPGGQSGHPLSPHFQDGFAAWAAGTPADSTRLLAGEPVHTLTLIPSATVGNPAR